MADRILSVVKDIHNNVYETSYEFPPTDVISEAWMIY